jgi:hypothetical protein
VKKSKLLKKLFPKYEVSIVYAVEGGEDAVVDFVVDVTGVAEVEFVADAVVMVQHVGELKVTTNSKRTWCTTSKRGTRTAW